MYSGLVEEILQLYDLGYDPHEIAQEKEMDIESIGRILVSVWVNET